MADALSPVRIEPESLYHDAALVLLLGTTHAALARARRAGVLRHTRQGRRVFYRGAWVLDWLDRSESTPAKCRGASDA